jgi:hypothetical protein
MFGCGAENNDQNDEKASGKQDDNLLLSERLGTGQKQTTTKTQVRECRETVAVWF